MSAEKPNPGDAAPQVDKLVQTTISNKLFPVNVFTKSLYNQGNVFNFSQFGPLKAFISKTSNYK